MESLEDVLAGFAAWLGHGHGDRAGAWAARLQVNRPEIESFRAAQTPAVPAYAATPARLEEPAGDGPHSPASSEQPLSVSAALERARRHPEWHIFTRLADAA